MELCTFFIIKKKCHRSPLCRPHKNVPDPCILDHFPPLPPVLLVSSFHFLFQSVSLPPEWGHVRTWKDIMSQVTLSQCNHDTKRRDCSKLPIKYCNLAANLTRFVQWSSCTHKYFSQSAPAIALSSRNQCRESLVVSAHCNCTAQPTLCQPALLRLKLIDSGHGDP